MSFSSQTLNAASFKLSEQLQRSEGNLPIEEIMVALQNHIDLAKSGMEYMLRTKGYTASVALSNIKLRY